MSHSIWVRNFTAGLDTRRMPETTPPGPMIRGYDGHINRGGDFEQRAAFVARDTLPAGTVGLAATVAGLVTFGSASAPSDLPAFYAYQQLDHDSKTLDRVMSWDLFSGKIYAAARYDDGTRMHHYDGAVVAAMAAGGPTDPVPGDFVLTHNRKLYSLSGSVVWFSAIGDPEDHAGTGAGFIDLAEEVSGPTDLMAIAPYGNNLAIFARQSIPIYYFDADPAKNAKVQVLDKIGTDAGLSAVQYGDNDLFFEDTSGVRSLRARNSSNNAGVEDIGVAIDDYVKVKFASLTDEQKIRVKGLIEPSDKRFWLVLGNEIAVLSHFPGSKIQAWTIYRPGFWIDDVVEWNRRLYLRSGDTVYVYGGEEAEPVYDAAEAEMWLPFFDADKPTVQKTWNGVDLACQGAWEVRGSTYPQDLNVSDKLATISATTYNLPTIPIDMEGTHFGLRLKSAAPGKKKISSICISYDVHGE